MIARATIIVILSKSLRKCSNYINVKQTDKTYILNLNLGPIIMHNLMSKNTENNQLTWFGMPSLFINIESRSSSIKCVCESDADR